mmetsp:Transcript_119971/g.383047  ORF Transcript_119971/g.383047 Transcript_119971/m.383047 type:complete len:103 (+) Transcript_119971:1768-2076(+)
MVEPLGNIGPRFLDVVALTDAVREQLRQRGYVVQLTGETALRACEQCAREHGFLQRVNLLADGDRQALARYFLTYVHDNRAARGDFRAPGQQQLLQALVALP